MKTDQKLNMTMLCDFYELTMGNGYLKAGFQDRITYFDVYFRSVPDGGGYAIAAGLDQLIDYIEDLHFDQQDIHYLRGRGIFCEEFLDYLANFHFSGDIYANCILSTDGNVKVSMELGFSPEGSQPVLLHEIIGKNGLACDVVVDTQTQQYPIYVFKGKETLTYTDIDAELYDMENTQVDSVRFILWALSDISRIKALRENYAHIEKVYEAALAANASVRYTKVEG